MSRTFVLIHGAWHDGSMLDPLAQQLRAAGHTCFVPTLLGNRVGDDRSCLGFHDVVKDLALQIQRQNLQNFYLFGHSFGGMVISQLVQMMPDRIERLIYCSAFVPNDGECVMDFLPGEFVRNFCEQAEQYEKKLYLSFLMWRQLFTNETPADTAKKMFKRLRAQAFFTFNEPVLLHTALSDIQIPKTVIVPKKDRALPLPYSWHPYLASRLGDFDFFEVDGDHEVLVTNCERIAQVILNN